MLVVLGHSNDRDTRDLAQALHGAVLTPRDFVTPGWILPFPCWEAGQAIIDGRPIHMSQITAVITRLSGVAPSDLTPVRKADRRFAAREIHALLHAWLTQCRFPVINIPSGLSLSGELAASAAVPSGVSTATQVIPGVQRLSISIIDGQVVELYNPAETSLVGVRPDDVVARIKEWAATVQTPLAGIDMQLGHQGQWEITKIHTLPRLTSEMAQEMLREYLGGRRKGHASGKAAQLV